MCQEYLANVSPECYWCGGGYLANLGNYISHDKNCPATTGNQVRKQEILKLRAETEREKNTID